MENELPTYIRALLKPFDSYILRMKPLRAGSDVVTKSAIRSKTSCLVSLLSLQAFPNLCSRLTKLLFVRTREIRNRGASYEFSFIASVEFSWRMQIQFCILLQRPKPFSKVLFMKTDFWFQWLALIYESVSRLSVSILNVKE